MLLNAIIGYVLVVIEDEDKKKRRAHEGRHREGLPGKSRRSAGKRARSRR